MLTATHPVESCYDRVYGAAAIFILFIFMSSWQSPGPACTGSWGWLQLLYSPSWQCGHMLIYILYYSHLKLSAASKMQWDTLQISALNINKCIYKYLSPMSDTLLGGDVRLEGNVQDNLTSKLLLLECCGCLCPPLHSGATPLLRGCSRKNIFLSKNIW